MGKFAVRRFGAVVMPLARVPLAACAIIASATLSPAQTPASIYDQALETVRQYGRDMSLVMPCAYMGGLGDPNTKIVDQWGEAEVRKTLDKFAKLGASAGQVATLLKAFEDNYRPNFATEDIRKFARDCWDREIVHAMYMMTGRAIPLSHRTPFSP